MGAKCRRLFVCSVFVLKLEGAPEKGYSLNLLVSNKYFKPAIC